MTSMMEQLIENETIKLVNCSITNIRATFSLITLEFSTEILRFALTDVDHLVHTFGCVLEKLRRLVVFSEGFDSLYISKVARKALNSSFLINHFDNLADFEDWMVFLRTNQIDMHDSNDLPQSTILLGDLPDSTFIPEELSILSAKCFRKTLLSLLSKYQFLSWPSLPTPFYRSPTFDFRFSPPPLTTSFLDKPIPLDDELSESENLPPFNDEVKLIRTPFAVSNLSSMPFSVNDEDVSLSSEDGSMDMTMSNGKSSSYLEQLRLITILHSLISRPYSEKSLTNTPTRFTSLVRHSLPLHDILHDDTCSTFSFSPADFDEERDDEIIRTLIRCASVVQKTASLECITDLPTFLELLLSVLQSSSPPLRQASLLLLRVILLHSPPYLCFHEPVSLKDSFRDGSTEEQIGYLVIICHNISSNRSRLNTHIFWDFDFDGFLMTDLSDPELFRQALMFIMLLRLGVDRQESRSSSWFDDLFRRFYRRNITHITSSLLDPQSHSHDQDWNNLLHSFLVIASLLNDGELPPVHHHWIQLLTSQSDPSIPLKLVGVHPRVFLSFCPINWRFSSTRLPVDLFFDRICRQSPISFFRPVVPSGTNTEITTSSFSSICPSAGLHNLFARQLVRPDRMTRDETTQLFDIVFQDCSLFLRLCQLVPPPSVIRGFAEILTTRINAEIDLSDNHVTLFILSLLTSTAPFGACPSLNRLLSRLPHILSELGFRYTPSDLSGFLSNPAARLYFRILQNSSFSNQYSLLTALFRCCMNLVSLAIPPAFSWFTDPFTSYDALKKIATLVLCPQNTNLIVLNLSSLYPHLDNADIRCVLLRQSVLQILIGFLVSPMPSVVSVALTVLTQLVRACTVSECVLLVEAGVVDAVIVSVSLSSFLDDYENGLCVVGIVLNSIRQQELIRHVSCFNWESLIITVDVTTVQRRSSPKNL
ncbi:hypothetical protein BLNAU_9877 [Blattamonas nauphoetae]|uniref:Uncharacterized protein n=1 Tax=Blattamonas nauphoetae TaxID=2049346 RepID=A0ABQ9XUJ0_9EUKA|nr:hypothetical protein BLNAU_9877 [Blattamonas nauphoetae]